MSVEVVLDSMSPDGDRITTFELEFPRFILAEFNTHRAFSRNSASSRAVPALKLVERVESRPFVPTMGYNIPGMSSATELNEDDQRAAQAIWEEAAGQMAIASADLHYLGVHKQWANRLLEPFLYHRVLLTTCTEGLANFFEQRLHGAQPEMEELAAEIWQAIEDSEPTERNIHVPYTAEERDPSGQYIERSVACCARVSYDNFDGPSSVKKDLELYAKLLSADPPHWSPFEHQAIVMPGRHANLDGWMSFRTRLEASDHSEITAYLVDVYKRIESM